MINTKNLVVNEASVPSYWVFQYYLNLNEKLTGQDIKIKSIWNPGERTPSLCIFVDKKNRCYKFKDFSTGKYGNKINLIQQLFDLNYSAAVEKIINDYNKFVTQNGCVKINLKPEAKWKLDFIKKRKWTSNDADYWLQYRIGSSLLNEYNVNPIEYYNLVKEENNSVKVLKVQNAYCYGFYTTDNDVFKIYQPKNLKRKFFKVKSHIQGLDQLKYNQPYLIIVSSLKDLMTIKGMGYNIELIAPDSENTMIKPYIIENLKTKYNKIITLFDNDSAGKKAVTKYKCVYNLNGFTCPIENDPAEAMQKHGLEIFHSKLKPLLKSTLNL